MFFASIGCVRLATVVPRIVFDRQQLLQLLADPGFVHRNIRSRLRNLILQRVECIHIVTELCGCIPTRRSHF